MTGLPLAPPLAVGGIGASDDRRARRGRGEGDPLSHLEQRPRPHRLDWVLAALPAPIPINPATKRPATIERPRMLMPWPSKPRRTFSRISHFPLLAPSSQEAFEEEESVRFVNS